MSQNPNNIPKYRILERAGVFRVQERHLFLGFIPMWKYDTHVPSFRYEWEPYEFPSKEDALLHIQNLIFWDQKHIEEERIQKQKPKKWRVVEEI